MGYRSNSGIVIFGPESEMLANLTARRPQGAEGI